MGDHTVAVIGVGTVGQSWAALFLSYGNKVRLWDPAAGLAERFAAFLETGDSPGVNVIAAPPCIFLSDYI
jgi:3-hydroxyacyl-CoA dehydrogenase